MIELSITCILLSVFGWVSSFWITLIVVSFDKDKETYQLDGLTNVVTFFLWPIVLSFYVMSFIGNLLGKTFRWSKQSD